MYSTNYLKKSENSPSGSENIMSANGPTLKSGVGASVIKLPQNIRKLFASASYIKT